MTQLLLKKSLPPLHPGAKGGVGYWARDGSWKYGSPPVFLPSPQDQDNKRQERESDSSQEEQERYLQAEQEAKDKLRFLLDDINKGEGKTPSDIPVKMWSYIKVNERTGKFEVKE